MACPLRLILVAVSALVALVALVCCHRDGEEPAMDATTTSVKARDRGSRSWKSGLRFVVDAFTGRYIYTKLVQNTRRA
ncbi:hypothetical protein TSOC_014676 [Tetrabaena socialis]|uniref:Secreted protein n=1 Tax=Tetrabaena socialis TaxID=47790 RepID=A0A2J7ZGZ0_9CHLO|nr:hypothetical protein TSOC_014676 [Tetrabaena socialis]|eukprot:PNG99543.1 hypothetical protein TSOC_014676 [Tetrabaena socialis]